MKTYSAVLLLASLVLAGCVTQRYHDWRDWMSFVTPDPLDSDGIRQTPAGGEERYLWLGNITKKPVDILINGVKVVEIQPHRVTLVWFPVGKFTNLDFVVEGKVQWGLEFVIYQNGPSEKFQIPQGKGETTIFGKYVLAELK